jgi:DNA-binding GntR family transcriptional regulator
VTESEEREDPIRDVIAGDLRRDIMSGRLSPGQRLVETQVAQQYDVSRVPVREALRRLESEGFVTLTPHRGATVSVNSRRDSLELMQLRRGLETFAARLAAEHRGRVVAAELSELVDRQREAAIHEAVDALPPLILHFHELVARGSENTTLERAIDRTLQSISWGFELDIRARIDSSLHDHAAIASAILAGSPVQAAYLMDEHIAKDERLYLEKIRPAHDEK